MSLRLIASYDDLVQLCGLDSKLADKYTNVMEKREVSFDPIMACASNPDLLVKGHFFSKKGKESKRALNSFDSEKFTKKFIKCRSAELTFKAQNVDDDSAESADEKSKSKKKRNKTPQGVVRSGFDAYAYLMAYEMEINEMYSMREDLSLLQKAALYFVETGSAEQELDYVKYLASFDDLSVGSLQMKPADKELVDWLPECGKWHYETSGMQEIMSGSRPVTPFFNATKYIASYPETYDAFKNEDGSLNEDAARMTWFTFGCQNGLSRNGFSPMVYLANSPDICKEDIYTNNKVDELKVAKKWLDNFSNGIDLTVFDVEDFKEANELREDEDPFKLFVERKVSEFQKEVKNNSKLVRRMAKKMPGLPKLSMPNMLSCGSNQKVNMNPPSKNEESTPETESEAVSVPMSEPEPEPVSVPEPELSIDELKAQLKETQDQIAVFDTKAELETAKKKLEKLKSKK